MRTIALYCGSFNPFHVGHLNILEKAENIFGKGRVIVCQGVNSEKAESTYRIGKSKALNDRPIMYYKNLIWELIHQVEVDEQGNNVVLIRGIRNGFDLEKENAFIETIKSFKPDLQVIYIPCDKKYEHVSSTMIRALNKSKEGIGNKFMV